MAADIAAVILRKIALNHLRTRQKAVADGADDGLNGGSPSEFLLDLAVNAALLSKAEDPAEFWRIMADIDPFDLSMP